MNGARDKFFTRPRFAGDEHGRLDLGHRLDHLIDGLHAIGLADDVAQFSARALSFDQRFILVLQRLLFFDNRNLLQRARDFLF